MQDVDKDISSLGSPDEKQIENEIPSQALQNITRKNTKLKNPYDSSTESEKNHLPRKLF